MRMQTAATSRQLPRTEICLCLAGFLYLYLVPAFASGLPQQTQPSVRVRGHVVESSGARLPNVRIIVRNPKGTVAAKTTTDANGQFLISGVPPGAYVLEAERKLFESSRTEIVLSPSTALPTIEILMKLASRKETVDVLHTEGYVALDTSVGSKTNIPILEAPFSIQVVPQQVLQDQQTTRLAQAV